MKSILYFLRMLIASIFVPVFPHAFTPEIIAGTAPLYGQTEGIDLDSDRVFAPAEIIAELFPSETPFLSMLLKLKRQTTPDHDFKWFEDRPVWLKGLYVTLNDTGGLSLTSVAVGGAVDVEIDDAAAIDYLQANCILAYDGASNAGASFLVTSISTTTITCKLIRKSTAALTVPDDAVLNIYGSANYEGHTLSAGRATTKVTHWGSTQIHDVIVDVTRYTQKTKLVHGLSEYIRIYRERFKTFKTDWEKMLLFNYRPEAFGQPDESYDDFSPGSNKKRGFSMGIQQAIEQTSGAGFFESRLYSVDASTYNMGDFIDDMALLFRYGSPTKYAFTSDAVIAFYNKMAVNESMIKIEPGENALGIQVMTLLYGGKKLKLTEHPALTHDANNYTKMFVTDMDKFTLMEFDPIQIENDVHVKGYHGKQDKIWADMGLKCELPEASALFQYSNL